MIDNLKISLQEFTGDFGNCKPIKSGSRWRNYILFRSSRSDAPLSVGYDKHSHRLNIKGSIRKWYFEDASTTNDLGAEQAKEAFEELAELLLISVEELRRGAITQCELGLNIPLRCPASVFTSTLVAYGTYQLERRDGSVTFYRTDNHRKKERLAQGRKPYKQKVACIYDKLSEIEYHRATQRELKKSSITTADHNILRIEFVLHNRQAFKSRKIGECSLLGGLLDNYDSLYLVWAREYKKLFFQPKLDRNSPNYPKSDRGIIDNLEENGYDKIIADLDNDPEFDKRKRTEARGILQATIALTTIRLEGDVNYHRVGLSAAIHKCLTRGQEELDWEIRDIREVVATLHARYLSTTAKKHIKSYRRLVLAEQGEIDNKGKKS